MTLEIAGGVSIKTWWDDTIHLHIEEKETEITLKDFCAMAYYVLVNSDLLEDDARLGFVEIVKRLTTVEGYDKLHQRLVLMSKEGKEGHSLIYPGYWKE